MWPSKRKCDRAGSIQIVVDLALPLLLALALAAVFVLDFRGLGHQKEADDQVKVEAVTEEPAGPPQPVRRLRLAVTPNPAQFDDMGKLLEGLGEGYRFTKIGLEDLRNTGKICEFDVLFLTCSGVPRSWLSQRIGMGSRPGTESFAPNPQVIQEVTDSLRQFVKKGGTLYASDLHFILIQHAFEEYVDREKVNEGKVQDVDVDVVDSGLRELIGPRIPLRFDQPEWRPAAFTPNKATIYLRGTYKTMDGRTDTAPLLVKFSVGDGTVVFTSFHNEKQNSDTETKLLRYLVFTAVTAEVDTRVTKMMLRGGFSKAKQNLFSASAGDPSTTQVYHCPQKGDLQFVLGFENQGARLKMTVTGPDGKVYEKEGTSTFTIDIPGAVEGDWKYTVTALHVPADNFPFAVSIGKK